MRIGIDLTWFKPKKSGGVEFFMKYLIDGFTKLNDENEYMLLLADDNSEYLRHFFNPDKRVTYIDCNTKANAVAGHLLWQNTREYSVLRKNGLSFCFFPVFEMPIYKNKNIKTVTTIHDVQAIHFPDYFKKYELIWFNFAWQKDLDNADKVVTLTDFTNHDIQNHYNARDNIVTIYNPVSLDITDVMEFDQPSSQYGIKRNEYFYTVSSMHKHKNLITLLKMMKTIQEDNLDLPRKLVISGVGGPNKENLLNEIREMGIENNVILTAFVSSSERNSLIQNDNIFLFPSIFEGFGVPPVEALMLGSKVLTTKETSIPEVTMNRCNYVNDPYDVDEWISNIRCMQTQIAKTFTFEKYSDTYAARQYLNLFYKVAND